MNAAARLRPVRRIAVGRAGLWIGVLILAAIWMVPFVFIVFTSLKTQASILGTPAYSPPMEFVWENYLQALQRGNLLNSALNSAIISAIKVPAGLFVSALAAFALARLNVPYAQVMLALLTLGTLVPIQVAIAPLFRIILGLGLLDTYLGVILPYIAFGIPYQVFILYGFFRAIPLEMDEAARMDGTSNMQLFWHIIIPLAKPALAALFILDFVATWNEFAIALVILQGQDSWTIPLALQGFNTQFTSLYGPLNAAIVLSILPVLVVYALFQKYFVEGTFAGAVKG